MGGRQLRRQNAGMTFYMQSDNSTSGTAKRRKGRVLCSKHDKWNVEEDSMTCGIWKETALSEDPNKEVGCISIRDIEGNRKPRMPHFARDCE